MAVRIEGLKHYYGEMEAVAGVSLEIGQGELFGLLGPNGAGKSTILSILATLLEVQAGTAEIFGHDLRRNPMAARRITGFAPQNVSLYLDLDADENIRFFGHLYGLRGPDLARATTRVLELVGLTDRAGGRARTYSGGMLRRLNLACGLVHEPQLLLLDEPTVGVDPHSREKLLATIRDIADSGTTVIYTTHYMEEAQRLCDRIAILDQGLVLGQGTLNELLAIVGLGEAIHLRGEARVLAAADWSDVPGLMGSEETSDGLRLFVEKSARALGAVSAVLGATQHEIRGVEVYPVDLERVFMHLTGRELRD